MQKEFIKTVVASMTNPEQSQVADSKPKVPASDDAIYRTKALALAELYKANEVAADDKIGGRKVEVTGTVQDITKNFTDDVVLKLESGNRFMPVSLSMSDSEKAKASKLEKGQKITVTCEKSSFSSVHRLAETAPLTNLSYGLPGKIPGNSSTPPHGCPCYLTIQLTCSC